jgi:hypothetical protein
MCLREAQENRQEIRNAAENADYPALRLSLAEANDTLEEARLIGNLILAAFFMEETERARNSRLHLFSRIISEWAEDRYDLSTELVKALGFPDDCPPMYPVGYINVLCREQLPLMPFHWDVEFPEVFRRDNPGFDAIIGNPPFAGKNSLINSNPDGYLDWLKAIHEESHGNADFVAHFFRRAFSLLRQQGAFGLIATNTIGQGDTRATGLRWICTHGGTIFNARKRYKWPGQAAVIVSVVHIFKGTAEGPFPLDGRPVPVITAFLFHAGGHESPATLSANAGKSFIGSYVLGMGFTFDDTDTKGVATPIAEMHRLVEKNPSMLAASFDPTDDVEANFSTRVKMGQSSDVYAVALTADGKALFAKKEVKVTLGGCGG